MPQSVDQTTSVDLSSGHTEIPCKWIYAIKRDVNGKIERYSGKRLHAPVWNKFSRNFSISYKVFDNANVSAAYLNSDLQDEI